MSEEKKNNAEDLKMMITFLEETKKGKYVEVDKDIIERPRVTSTRDDFCFDESQMICCYGN